MNEKTKRVIENLLYDVCDNEHSNCNLNCPVYAINSCVPDTVNDFKVNRGCDCFKEGAKMFSFIEKAGK